MFLLLLSSGFGPQSIRSWRRAHRELWLFFLLNVLSQFASFESTGAFWRGGDSYLRTPLQTVEIAFPKLKMKCIPRWRQLLLIVWHRSRFRPFIPLSLLRPLIMADQIYRGYQFSLSAPFSPLLPAICDTLTNIQPNCLSEALIILRREFQTSLLLSTIFTGLSYFPFI